MHAASDSREQSFAGDALLRPEKSRHSPLTWSRLARFIAVTAYTSGTVASFTTPASRMASRADRWRTSLSYAIRTRPRHPNSTGLAEVQFWGSGGARALASGRIRYRLLTNHCEHFCSRALRDECYSKQSNGCAPCSVRCGLRFAQSLSGARRCKPVPTYRLTA
jgi:hypothetical protein